MQKINTIKNNINDVDAKVVRKNYIARQLLRNGHQIIDIKPDKKDPDKKRTVFVFANTDALQKDLDKILHERDKSYEEDIETRILREVERRFKEMQENNILNNNDLK